MRLKTEGRASAVLRSAPRQVFLQQTEVTLGYSCVCCYLSGCAVRSDLRNGTQYLASKSLSSKSAIYPHSFMPMTEAQDPVSSRDSAHQHMSAAEWDQSTLLLYFISTAASIQKESKIMLTDSELCHLCVKCLKDHLKKSVKCV